MLMERLLYMKHVCDQESTIVHGCVYVIKLGSRQNENSFENKIERGKSVTGD